MLASRFLLNSYICSIQDTRNAHNKSPEQNNAMDTKNPLDFWYPSTCNQFKNINELFEITKDKENILQLKIKHLKRNGSCIVTEKNITVN